MTCDVKVWLPKGRQTPSGLAALTEAAGAAGGARALPGWLTQYPGRRVAYVHGPRHSLWWEFPLWDSFRWQGHLGGMRPAAVRHRTLKLAAHFGLTGLLTHPVESLTPAQRKAADLAVALLTYPELLVWEEPLATADLAHQVRTLCQAEGTTVVAVSVQRLHGLTHPNHLERDAAYA